MCQLFLHGIRTEFLNIMGSFPYLNSAMGTRTFFFSRLSLFEGYQELQCVYWVNLHFTDQMILHGYVNTIYTDSIGLQKTLK